MSWMSWTLVNQAVESQKRLELPCSRMKLKKRAKPQHAERIESQELHKG